MKIMKGFQLLACLLGMVAADNCQASSEGDEFFRNLKTSGKDALLIKITEGALSEEICKRIESLPKQEGLMKDLGESITIYVLDRSGKDPLTLDIEERYFFDNIPLGILIDQDGKPVGKTIITDDRKDYLMREIKRLRGFKQARDKAFAESAKSEKGYSVKLLDQGLNSLPKNELAKYYQKEVQQILQGDDPELVQKYQTILAGERDRSVVEAALDRLRRKVSGGSIDLQGIIAHLDEEKSKEGLSNEIKQKLEMHKFRYYSGSKNFDKALASLEEAFALAPKSELAGKIEGFKVRIQKAKATQEKTSEVPTPSPEPK